MTSRVPWEDDVFDVGSLAKSPLPQVLFNGINV